jgi:prepilin-type N-terminal cleavage/methylation domain-containing protein
VTSIAQQAIIESAYSTINMLAFNAYLANPKVRETLRRKPGEAGFSLIELVVVVAVLAILAAIAIPAFTSINDKAAVSAAQNTVAQIVKECAVKKANNETEEFNIPNLNSYVLNSAVNGDKGECDGSNDEIELVTKNGASDVLPKEIAINVQTGEKRCEAGDDDNDNLYCSADDTW